MKCAITAFHRQFELSARVTPRQIMIYKEVQPLIDNSNHIYKGFLIGCNFSVVITIVLSVSLSIFSSESLDLGAMILITTITLESFRVRAAIHSFV